MQEMWETRVRSLGQEDPLEEEMATNSNILENSMDRGAWQATPMGLQRVRHDVATKHKRGLRFYISVTSVKSFPPG